MSDDTIDSAVQRVRDAFDQASSEAEQMSESAKQEVSEAIDNLEQQIEQVRNN